MKYQQLLQSIEKEDFQPIYFLHGQEPYFIDVLSDKLIEKALPPAQRDFNLSILYGKETSVGQIIDQATRYPMMAARQVVCLREAQAMQGLHDLASYIKKPTPTTVLILCYKYKKLDLRTAFAKALKEQAVLFESKKLYDNQLPDWIRSQVTSMGYEIKAEAAHLLAEYVGADLSRIQTELDKLCVNLSKGESISISHIEEYIGISKSYNVFELQRALSKRDHITVQKIVFRFSQNMKQHPLLLIVSSLFSYFQNIYVLHSIANKSPADKLKALRLRSSYFLSEYEQAARKYSPKQIEQIISILHTYDLRSKGIGQFNTPESENLQQMIVEILAAKG